MKRWRWACLAASLFAAGTAADTSITLRGPSVMRPGAPSVSLTTSVRSLYLLKCLGCHGIDGAGAQSGGVPDMRRLGLFLHLDGGREFIVKVPGVMGVGMSDAQIAAVTNWVLETIARDSLPAAHRPYDAEEIGRARLTPLVDVAAARARLIEQARARGLPLR